LILTGTFSAESAIFTKKFIAFQTMFSAIRTNDSTFFTASPANARICSTIRTLHTGIAKCICPHTIDAVLAICTQFIRAVFAGFKAFTTDHRAFIASISAAAHVGTIPTHSAVSAKITGTIPANTAGSAHFI
jgi:hypothetical protein